MSSGDHREGHPGEAEVCVGVPEVGYVRIVTDKYLTHVRGEGGLSSELIIGGEGSHLGSPGFPFLGAA